MSEWGTQGTGPRPDAVHAPESPASQTSLSFNAAKPQERAPGAGVRLTSDPDGIAWILFDLPGEKVNTLTPAVLDELRELLDLAARQRPRGLAVASDKPGMFLAGADVNAIAQVRDASEGAEKAKQGQAVFEALAGFPAPTVTVVTGPCLGGGYELALASQLIIAEDRPEVRIGLPEVKLGILPGFGGTQRLPRRAGLRVALDMILAGKTLPARPAYRRGLVDLLVPEDRGRDIAREVLLGRRRASRRPRPFVDRAIESVPPVRNYVLSRARQALAARVRETEYPAPFRALDSVAASYRLPSVQAYSNEARLVGELVVTETSRNLVWLFLESRRSKEPPGLNLAVGTDVRRTALVGAGVMGGGIAWLAAEKGIPIRVRDIDAAALDRALATAARLWNKEVARRRISAREREHRLEQVSFTLDFTGFRTVDLVFEAVVEDLAIKQRVVDDVEGAVDEHAVIATNTSSLCVADVAARAERPERIVGLHFFNPVDRMPLVEVVAGPRSSPRAVATAYRLALTLGKTPVLVKDGPGFLVNRLLAFYLGEALALMESGADPQVVDGVLVRFGMPMGPFELLDQIGIDVAEKITHIMKNAFGERLPQQASLARLAALGHAGRKAGRGFYVYDENGKKSGWNPEADRAAGNPVRREVPHGEILDRLVLPMIHEAARCLDEGIVGRPLDVDLAMVMGTGFPAFRGGLLRYADQRGVGEIVARLDALAQTVDRRFSPGVSLRRRVDGFHAGVSAPGLHAGASAPGFPAGASPP